MRTSHPVHRLRTRRSSMPLVLLAALLAPTAALADGSTIREVTARADGARTVITLRGTGVPSFTAYRLEQPARLVVDLAGGRLDSPELSSGPIDVDTWAVGQVAMAQYSTATTRTARVMIGLKRAVTYDVKARGNDVVVTITPEEQPPADAQKTTSVEEKARTEAARQARLVEEQKRKEAESARGQALSDKDKAEAERAQAERAAQAARVAAARETEAARVAREAAARDAQAARDAAARDAQAARVAATRDAETARAAAAKDAQAAREAAAHEAQTAQIARETARVALARAEKERADMAREVEKARAVRQQMAAERAREEEALQAASRSADEKAEATRRLEAARLDAEKRLAAREADLARLEAARREAEKRARASDEELARRNAQQKIETERLARAREAEQKRLDETRAETDQLVKARDAERRELEALRRERERLAQEKPVVTAAPVEKPAAKPAIVAVDKPVAKPAIVAVDKPAAKPAIVAVEKPAAKPVVAPVEKPAVARGAIVKPAVAKPAATKPALAAADKPAARTSGRTPALDVVVDADRAHVTAVDFQDEEQVARVVIAVAGDPEFSLVKTPVPIGRERERTAVLRVRGADLAPRLARTLDTSAFGGPVTSISTYPDPDDHTAVRIMVKLASAVEPEVRKERGRIVWDFPKATLTGSFKPARVASFGLQTVPLQLGDPSSMGPRGPRSATVVGSTRQRFTGAPIDLDLKDADIHNILRLIADVARVNIITSDDVKGTVTIRMRGTPWDQALDVILRTKGLGQVREGNIIRVAPQSVLDKEADAEEARRNTQHKAIPLTTKLIPLSYATALSMMPRVQDLLSPRGKVSVDERTNYIIVTDIPLNVALAEDLIRNLDTQTPQVLIEARIVEARTSFLRDVGIQWGGNSINSTGTGNPTGIGFPSTVGIAGGNVDNVTKVDGLQNGQALSPNYVVNLPAAVGTGSGGALGFTFGSVAGNLNVNLRLSAAETSGNVRILSAPKITTLDNVQASIEQGTAIPISVVSAAGVNTIFVDAKLNLTVKPHVTNEGSIVMMLDITRNEPDFSHTGARGDPTILKKQAKTEMLVRDGDTAVIGGIYSRNSSVNYNKIPWLGDIPILGWLFKQKRENDDRSELLIFITPRIVNRSNSVAASR